MATEDAKKKKRNSYDEIDPDTGKAYEDVPGLEPDQVTESILTAPLGGMGGAATAGEGMVARMISRGVPSVASTAAQAAEKTAATGAAAAAGRAATGLSTREINSALRSASPRVQDMVLNQPGMMDRLKSEGLGLLQKLEEQIKEGTKSVARGSIGAKLRDQMPSPQSNPSAASYPTQPTRRPI